VITAAGSKIFGDVVSCDISSSNYGIAFYSDGSSGTVVGNTVNSATSGFAISVTSGTGMRILNNTLSGGLGGIVLSSNVTTAGGNIVQGNTIFGASADGIQLYSQPPYAKGNLVKENTISFCGAHGIEVGTSDNTIVGNVINFNNNGVFIDGGAFRNLIDSNQLDSNTGYGLYFGQANAANAYRNNMLRGNTSGSVGGSQTGNTNSGGNII
jgi:hypothetical protein